jgi:hypothetical protein
VGVFNHETHERGWALAMDECDGTPWGGFLPGLRGNGPELRFRLAGTALRREAMGGGALKFEGG